MTYGWPDPWEISTAVWNMPEPLALVPMGRAYLAQTDGAVLNSVIATSIVVSAHDIVDPRLAYRGPWTKGWSPLG